MPGIYLMMDLQRPVLYFRTDAREKREVGQVRLGLLSAWSEINHFTAHLDQIHIDTFMQDLYLDGCNTIPHLRISYILFIIACHTSSLKC
jgi:hypothetical protein